MDSTNTLKIVIDSKGAKSNADALDKSLKSLERQGEKTSNSVHAMSGSIKALTGAMAGYLTVSQAVSKIDAYTNLENRLKLVTASQIELNKAVSDTFEIAQRSYQSWDSVVQVYQRFSDNAKTLKINMEQTARLTETVAKAVAISGASTQAAEAALTQFGQALASGVLRGEELNSIMEQTPALAKAIASGMGITVGQLRSVASEGQITGDVLVKALGKAAADVDAQFSKTAVTIGQSMTYASNAVTNFASNASTAGGVAAKAIVTIADNIELMTSAAMVAGAYYVGSLIPAITAAAIATAKDTAAKVADLAATRAKILADYELARSNLAATAAMIRSMNAINAETAAMVANARATYQAAAAKKAAALAGTSVLGVLGGPVGIGITVASVAAGYLLMRDNTAQATAKLEEQAQVAQKTRGELLQLEGAQKRAAISDIKQAFEQQNKALKELNFQYNSAVIAVQNANKGNRDVIRISNEVRQGVISQAEALRQLNQLPTVTPEQIRAIEESARKYEEQRDKALKSQEALKVFGIEVTLAGNRASNAVGGINSNTNSLNDNAAAARDAANAQSEFIKGLAKTAKQTAITNNLIAKGWDVDRAKLAAQAYTEGGGKISGADIKVIDQNIAANRKLQATEEAIAKARQKAASAGRSAASASAKAAKAEAKQAEQLESEINSIRERYTYQYADRAKQIEIELQEQLKDIRKAGMGAEYEARARQWAELEKKYFDAQLDYENKEYKLNEREKLAYRMYMSEIATQKDNQLTNDQKRARLKAISDQTNFELDQIILASNKRMFEAERDFMSRQEQIKKLGELERREIQLNASLTAEERKRLEMASMRKTDMESNEARASAWGDYESMSGDLYGTSELVNIKNQLEERRAVIEEARAQDLIDTEEYNRRLRDIELDAWTQRQQFNITQAQNTFGAATEIMKNAFGEQSKAYQVMFAIEKSFAVANAGLSMVNNISKAASMGFPMNLPLIAGAMAQAAQISSLIASVAAPKTTGFADGGYTGDGGKYDVAGLVHRGEIVWSQDDIKRAGGKNVVEAMRTGQKQQQSSPSVSPINQTIANFIDPALFEQFLRSDAGQRAFINTISDNSTAIRRAL